MEGMLTELRERAERLIRRLRVPMCRAPFVVLFEERSGSSHLCSMLDSHPQVLCRHEDFINVHAGGAQPPSTARRLRVFEAIDLDNPDARQSVAHLYDLFSAGRHACGFKFKYPAQMDAFPEIGRELRSLGPRLRVIVLTRRNVLKQSVSRQKMLRIQQQFGENNLYSSLGTRALQQTRHQRVEVDVPQTIAYAERLAGRRADFEKTARSFIDAAGGACHRLTYEELLRDESAAVRGVLRFLGVDASERIGTRVHKATPNDLRDAVVNYDELARAVSGTPLEVFLSEAA